MTRDCKNTKQFNNKRKRKLFCKIDKKEKFVESCSSGHSDISLKQKQQLLLSPVVKLNQVKTVSRCFIKKPRHFYLPSNSLRSFRKIIPNKRFFDDVVGTYTLVSKKSKHELLESKISRNLNKSLFLKRDNSGEICGLGKPKSKSNGAKLKILDAITHPGDEKTSTNLETRNEGAEICSIKKKSGVYKKKKVTEGLVCDEKNCSKTEVDIKDIKCSEVEVHEEDVLFKNESSQTEGMF